MNGHILSQSEIEINVSNFCNTNIDEIGELGYV